MSNQSDKSKPFPDSAKKGFENVKIEENPKSIEDTSRNKEKEPFSKNNKNSKDTSNSNSKLKRGKIVSNLVRLALRKSPTHQLKNEELQKCGLNIEQCDQVREAISKADAFRSNIVFSSIASVFAVILGFLDTLFKVVLVTSLFLLILQIPYINSQANKHLRDSVYEAQFNYQKYEITLKQFSDILSKYKIKRTEEEIPQQIKEDREKSKRWIRYKGKKVETIWKEIMNSPLKSQDKINDLFQIYQQTLKYYSPGLPTQKADYLNAAIISLVVLLTYMFVQSLFGISSKSFFRYITLKNAINKVV
ncbi:MAG: hypothetical protein QNJ31_04835 [Candidatus Caenarcaniphilales bacterium]|nr:hypothetical protein [Candidatus Caenarcaniphilales bacterium]